jgi:hypothetical protein
MDVFVRLHFIYSIFHLFSTKLVSPFSMQNFMLSATTFTSFSLLIVKVLCVLSNSLRMSCQSVFMQSMLLLRFV